MNPDAETQLSKLGLRIEEFKFGREDEPDVIGFAAVQWLDLDHSRYLAHLLVRPGTSAEDRAAFAAWCCDAVSRWVSSGPEVDGWQRRESDAGWQLWCRKVTLPSID